MTGNKSLFVTWKPKDGGNVTFGDNTKGQIVGTGSIGNKDITITNVLHVKGLKHNLLSISQLCDKNCIKVKLLHSLKIFVKLFKKKKDFLFSKLEVIMAKNLKIIFLIIIALKMVLNMNSQLLGLLNKMELLKG
ncbi:hypothetical protein CFOL_v3_28575 [Cephalotus follicularis]|uniref:Retrovirus-related Pol polyprotein from transposon TNT 1-94-like beta-barrel domain-containing protein n=1 Tax=Cephalotus follicularis TaxID=3775 RepID=A0A1Q3CY20_CEPFO|nr:hypothetical protein CFOL_v3_28575 [Cephalotus follicularis]